MSRQRIVIVGASLAGATVAATLRDDGFDGGIQLIGAEAQLPYNRPPLSKGYLRQQERFEDQLVKPAGYSAEQRIELTLGVRATAIDAKQKVVELEGGEADRRERRFVALGAREVARGQDRILEEETRERETRSEGSQRCESGLAGAFAGGLRTHYAHRRPCGRREGS